MKFSEHNVFTADSRDLCKPLCGLQDEDVPGSCLKLKRDRWFPALHICLAASKHPQRSRSPQINLALLSFIYIAVYTRQSLLLFQNRHEAMFPVTWSYPAVFRLFAQELSSVRGDDCVNQANLRIRSPVMRSLRSRRCGFPSSNFPEVCLLWWAGSLLPKSIHVRKQWGFPHTSSFIQSSFIQSSSVRMSSPEHSLSYLLCCG